jgi:tRNA (cmo5U34)-methyltransferase
MSDGPIHGAGTHPGASSLGHLPQERWSFDDDVTLVFEDMLMRSIPGYETMRGLVTRVGKRFVAAGSVIVDIGCSRGDALAPFVQELGAAASYVGVELSPPMLTACRERFAREIEVGCLSLVELDLREAYPEVMANLTLSVLTLQFVPIEHRPRVLRDVFRGTAPGGALVVVEKILGSSAAANELLAELYYDLKRQRGYGEEEIERKRLSLEGVLVPVTASWNEDLLRRAGFAEVECFWRCLNFAGWVAMKAST